MSMKESKPTQVMFVGPHKLAACLTDAAECIGPDRRCVVARWDSSQVKSNFGHIPSFGFWQCQRTGYCARGNMQPSPLTILLSIWRTVFSVGAQSSLRSPMLEDGNGSRTPCIFVSSNCQLDFWEKPLRKEGLGDCSYL